MATASLLSEYSLSESVFQAVTSATEEVRARTIVFSSQKGGSGKTTLCGQLAVQAELAGRGPVALIDTDPQGSLSDWWNAREDETPVFVKTSVENLYDTIDELHNSGIKLVFIDTQPTVTDTIREIIRYGDLIVIPTRPSPHDLRAIGPTVDLVEQCNKPMVFAINSATRRAKITGDVAIALSQHGTVAPTTVYNRIDFATSMINGLSVMEINPEGKSAEEIRNLWDYIGGRLMHLEKEEGYQTFGGMAPPPKAVPEVQLTVEEQLGDGEPVYVEADPVYVEPIQTEPIQAEPVYVEPLYVEPVQAEPIQAEPVQAALPAPESETHNRPPVKAFGRRKTKAFGRRRPSGFGFKLTESESALWE